MLLVTGAAAVAAPFILSSVAIDQHGIDIAGTVFAKRESIITRYDTWSRKAEITVEYQPPDSSSVRFFTTAMPPEDYDSFHKAQRVTVHYLRQGDIPKIPFAETLGKLQLLPVARLGGRNALTGLRQFFDAPARFLLLVLVAVVALLTVWRIARLPGFSWGVAICVLVTLAAFAVHQFPTPTPAPAAGVLQAEALVRSLDTIEWLFSGSHSRGIEAAQPIQVVGLEFVPAGHTEPVVAIDAIDEESIPGIKPDGRVTVDYERATPRNAHIRGASREFATRNLWGMAFELAAVVLVITVFLLAAHLLGRAWNRLLARR